MMKHGIRPVLAISALVVASLLASCAGGGPLADLQRTVTAAGGGGALTLAEITRGLKEALEKGTNSVVARLGRDGGFEADPAIRIPLPRSLAKAREFAARVGLAASFDELQSRLNHAAELATPKAKSLFLGAIREMSVDDARAILQGPDDAATRYFERKTRGELAGAMRPLVDQSLAGVGAVNTFNQLLASYRRIPFAPPLEADLGAHVVDKGMDGIFHYLAAEEKAIRTNPVERTTALLRRVFGAR